jgi:hypothetical protein
VAMRRAMTPLRGICERLRSLPDTPATHEQRASASAIGGPSRSHIRDGPAAARRLRMSSQTGSALGALDARSASVLGGQLVDRTPAKRGEFRDRARLGWTGRLAQFAGISPAHRLTLRLLAMQKVEGSSPFSRFKESPLPCGFGAFQSRRVTVPSPYPYGVYALASAKRESQHETSSRHQGRRRGLARDATVGFGGL